MKRFMSVLAAVLLLGVVAVPAMAHGPFGRGGSDMYGWGGGSGYCPSYGGAYDSLTTEQREQLNVLQKKFYDETAQLRKDLWNKRNELRNLLDETNPDVEKAKTVQNEISNIRTNLSEKRVEFEIEKRKIAPDVRFGRGYGYRNDFSRGRGGYGPGACWR